PLKRSKRTAAVIWDSRKEEILTDSDLREIDLYSFQGLLKHEGIAKFGEAFGMWQKDAPNFNIDGHYPVREMWDRASSCWQKILVHDSRSVLVVTHNAVNQALVATGLRGSRKLKPGALSLYVGDGLFTAALNAVLENSPLVIKEPSLLGLCALSVGLCLGLPFAERIRELTHDGLHRLKVIKSFEKSVFLHVWKDGKKTYSIKWKSKIYLGTNQTQSTEMNWSVLEEKSNHLLRQWFDHDESNTLRKSFGIMMSLLARNSQHGYPKETIGYSFYYPPENKIFVARNAEFLENVYNQEASVEVLEVHARTRRARRSLCVYTSMAKDHELGDLGEPANYKAAFLDPKSDK
ncbi:probable 2-carboxy-D-arabinitol-1-phosphatase, partial [Tanacetum coccineum]